MAQVKKIQLKINKNRLVQNLRDAFAGKKSFVAELMQNARRAGASRVEFRYDGERQELMVLDDGSGIEDLQHILTVAESGWDEETRKREHPYGLGFLSAIYQADTIEIRSRGRKTRFDTQTVLDFGEISVETAPTTSQTVILLQGVPAADYRQIVRDYAVAFPIPVYFDDEECPRPLALDNPKRRYQDSWIGQVYVRGLPQSGEIDGVQAVDETTLVLQGIVISGSSYLAEIDRANIVHLDPSKYKGQLPDRSRLLDEEIAKSDARQCIRSIWRSTLQRLSLKMDDAQRALWYPLIEALGMQDLLYDCDWVSTRAFRVRHAYPGWRPDWEDTSRRPGPPAWSRKEIEGGAVRLATEPWTPDDLDGDWLAAMYLYCAEAPIYAGNLGKDHWAVRQMVEVSPAKIHVRAGQFRKLSRFNGIFEGAQVLFVDRITLGGPLGSVDCDQALMLAAETEVVFEQGRPLQLEERTIIVPDAEEDGDVVMQLYDYTYGDGQSYDESSRNRDRHYFQEFLLSERPGNELQLLERLLRKAELHHYPTLYHQAFRIEVDQAGPRVSFEDSGTSRINALAEARFYRLDGDKIRVYEPNDQGLYSEVDMPQRTEMWYHQGLRDLLEQRDLPVFTDLDFERHKDQSQCREPRGGIDPALSFQVENIGELAESIEDWYSAPVVEDPDGSCRVAEGGETPSFWTVYGREQDGTSLAIIDTDSQALAEALVQRLHRRGIHPLP